MARDELVCKLARYVYCDRETTVLRHRDSRCCSASWRMWSAATGLRAARSTFLSFAQPHRAAVQGDACLGANAKAQAGARVSLLYAPSCRSRVGLAGALLHGRRRHAVAVVLDFRGVGLSPFSITVVRQGRLGGRAWGKSPLGHYDAPFLLILCRSAPQSMTLRTRNRLQGLRPNRSRSLSFAISSVRFRSVGRFRPARFI